jgi:uncharacterized protein YdaU (DUF1376 family)
MHLDPFQDGCYLRLVDHYMETRQPLPDNDAALARIIGISHEQWLTHASGIVRAFFKAGKGGVLTHKRCDLILKAQDDRTGKKSEIGKKGAEARWKKSCDNNDEDSKGMPKALPDRSQGNAIGQDNTRKDITYAFLGKTIKLTREQYDTWKKRYHAIADFDATLASYDDLYANDKKSWFIRLSRNLSDKHDRALQNAKPKSLADTGSQIF